jgi:hypothetical protein
LKFRDAGGKDEGNLGIVKGFSFSLLLAPKAKLIAILPDVC